MSWKSHKEEIQIPFDPSEEDLYRKEDPSSRYAKVRWSLSRGRTKLGEFPVVVVREYYRNLGYTVWASEPELPNDLGYLLVSYPGKRRQDHPAYATMKDIFGSDVIEALNKKVDEEKRRETGNAGGGDPDLFVFNEEERFFVEVKHEDEINQNQEIAFPLIEDFCETDVVIARIVPAG
jgi:hypothetical protein